MINKNNLLPLTEFNEDNVLNKMLILEGIKENLSLYVINERNSQAFKLSAGDIAKIQSNHPEKIHLLVSHTAAGAKIRQKCNLFDVWVEKNLAAQLLNHKNGSEYDKANNALRYTTPLLELQNRAIEKFWINHDPKRPPKSKVIIDWLKKEGASERVAAIIDTIIRHPAHKTGGNKARNNKTNI